jgi:hypothetical protein
VYVRMDGLYVTLQDELLLCTFFKESIRTIFLLIEVICWIIRILKKIRYFMTCYMKKRVSKMNKLHSGIVTGKGQPQ